jgi:hypothetical protein
LPLAAAPPVVHASCRAPVVLRPGARVLLRRGTVCHGSLVVTGRGPATIGAYGRGPRPRIEADGPEAVRVTDVSHVTVRDLELTNRGAEARRAGVRVVAKDGVVRDVTVRHVWVHDVTGDLSKGVGGSSAISLEASGNGRFDRLRVLRSRVERASRTGISLVGTADTARPDADHRWPAASTRVLIARNRVDRVGGDGIVVRGSVHAVVRGNVVSRGNLRGAPLLLATGAVCNAGIWAFHANRTLIERNEVFGMESHDCDGTGFDVDYDQDRTIIQRNYSHDNEGGFVLLCSDDAEHHRADVRFNLSLDDASTLNTVPCPATEGRVGDLSGIRVFNNTVVAERPRLAAEQFDLPVLVGGGDMVFADNVVAATSEQQQPFACGGSCTHNLFGGMPDAGTEPIDGDPSFADAARRGRGLAVGRGFRLRRGSPGIGAGVGLGGSRDYFGDPVGSPPTVGFATGPSAGRRAARPR